MPPMSANPARPLYSRVTLALFILSFLLHLVVVLAIRHYQHPALWENGMIAQYLYEGKGFAGDFSRIAEPTSWQAPGYPLALCVFWKLFGQNSSAYLFLSVTQCLAVASMVWPMGILSRRWFPDTPAWVVQALTVVAPLYLWYCTRLHHTAFVMAMHPWLLCFWLQWCRRGPWLALGCGLLTGIAALFQPVLLGVYGICGAVLLASSLFGRQWKAASCLCLAAIAVLLCLTPWTIRNYRVHGRLVFVKDSMGKELWMGNNPDATGTGYAAGGGAEITNVHPPKVHELKGKVPEIVLMNALGAEAWDYMKTHPAKTVDLTLHKILWFWTVAPANLVRTSGEGEALAFRGVYIAYWAAFVALALLGLITARPPAREYFATLVLFAVFYSGIYGLTHVGQARFRGEIEFIFLFGAAAGLFFLFKLLAPKTAAPSPAGR